MLKRLSKEKKGLYSFLMCLGFSILSIALFALLFGLVAVGGNDPTRQIAVFSLLSLISSALFSGIFTSRFCGEDGIVMSLLTCLTVTVIMFIFGAVLGLGKISSTVMNYLCYVGVFTFSAFIGRKRNKHRHHK